MLITNEEILLAGAPICCGIAIGYPIFFTVDERPVPEIVLVEEEIENEVARYRTAVSRGLEEIKGLQKTLQREKINDGAAILDAHLEMMQDPILTEHVEEQIRNRKKNAEHIFHTVFSDCQKKFDAVADPFFKERFKEIQDLYRRIMGYLTGGVKKNLSDIPQDTIIFTRDLTAFDAAEAKKGCIAAFVTSSGGATSHAAIVAKAKGIPYITNVDVSNLNISENALVIVDGRTGEIIIHPTEETLAKYRALRDQFATHVEKLNSKGNEEAQTYDGYTIRISANVEVVDEIQDLHKYSGSGVGLFRTESAFLLKDSLPSEEEQFNLYKQFVDKMDGLPIVIRTFDFGGDKYPSKQMVIKEYNPFLGCRAIRFSLKEKEFFKSQLRAILRASAFGDVSILFPMISSLQELLDAKAIFQQAREELESNGVLIAPRVPIGCMIEVPSAAMIADLLAKECDFLSIGTNDLVQYALAVDRCNNSLVSLYTPTHPSVLRLIKIVVNEANHQGIRVSVCGEIAADPRFAILLLGLGVHELSVASRYIPLVKNAVRSTSIVAASKLAERALQLSSALEIEELITQEYRLNVPEDCYFVRNE